MIGRSLTPFRCTQVKSEPMRREEDSGPWEEIGNSSNLSFFIDIAGSTRERFMIVTTVTFLFYINAYAVTLDNEISKDDVFLTNLYIVYSSGTVSVRIATVHVGNLGKTKIQLQIIFIFKSILKLVILIKILNVPAWDVEFLWVFCFMIVVDTCHRIDMIWSTPTRALSYSICKCVLVADFLSLPCFFRFVNYFYVLLKLLTEEI